MSRITNKIILITGGASGIGKIMGRKCMEEGASELVIWDINQKGLDEVALEFGNKGYKVHTYKVDVSDLESIQAAASKVATEVGTIDILFNNAGIVVGKHFEDHSYEDIEKTIRINVLGVMHIARAFVAGMIKKGAGHIVNISSASAFTPNPRMSVYAGSKWAVLGWSESLRLEMEQINESQKTDLHVTTVMPGYIDTGMFNGASAPLLTPLLVPEEIASEIIKAVKANEILVQEPFMVKLLPLLRGVLPARAYDFLAGNIFNVYNSMSKFTGRNEVSSTQKHSKDLGSATQEQEIPAIK
ncbi:SDR family NAD(P)-dependent oxidoreductase [Bernardetia sp. OM2101]|uniref:SDR family NAD(P)-dependent oxidoreductase n=1 Tax=Bernardetia sp. OM2101 TaxID=3344876 RepID=UPI0035CF07E2